ncbi:MAG: agmatinase [Candidatus Micrarchaeota archaeon]|nr:agmatinase [Candidatus Micrarchaeota archaeon]
MDIFHIGLPRTFLGVKNSGGNFSEVEPRGSTKMPNDGKTARYVVLSSPYEGTVSYGTGTKNGPHAIIEASRQVETYDIELARDFEGCGIYTADELEVSHASPEKNCGYVQEAVEEVLKAGKVPILLGGEHSVSVGAFSAIAASGKAKDVSVLHLDAHADMRDEYEGTKFNHACVMRRCREKLHAVSVGVRSYSLEEAQEIKRQKCGIFGVEFNEGDVLKKLRKDVYISIDLDAFDPSECPAVGTPEPGGLRWKQVTSLLRKVCEQRRIIGFDVVELAPIPGQHVSDFLAARLVYKLICYIEANRK